MGAGKRVENLNVVEQSFALSLSCQNWHHFEEERLKKKNLPVLSCLESCTKFTVILLFVHSPIITS